MKKVYYLILGVILVVFTSATTINVMNVKPIRPKYFKVQYFTQQIDAKEVAEYIRQQMKSGWLLKEVEGAVNNQYNSEWIVVLEKYE